MKPIDTVRVEAIRLISEVVADASELGKAETAYIQAIIDITGALAHEENLT